MPLYYAKGLILVVEAEDDEKARETFDEICGYTTLLKGCEGMLLADNIDILPAPTDWFNHDMPEELK